MDTNETVAVATFPRFHNVEIAEGEVYVGLSRNVETGTWHHLVLLPQASEAVEHAVAIDWAKSVGGELPTREESALIYANARDKVEDDDWYWTSTQPAGGPSYAWVQGFGGGGQTWNRKDDSYRARAVRRVPFE